MSTTDPNNLPTKILNCTQPDCLGACMADDAAYDLAVQAAAIRSVIKVSVKTIQDKRPGNFFWRSYKGVLTVSEPNSDFTDADGHVHHVRGRRYTKTISIERLSAGDALADAVRAREDCALTGQLP